MGSACVTTIPQVDSRYNRTRTASEIQHIEQDIFLTPIDVHKKYIFSEELEEGATGRVVKGTEKNNKNNNVAIKIMPKSSDHGNETAESLFKNEIDILTRIKHKNVVQLIDIGQDDKNYYVILELGKGGDLVEYIFDDNIIINEIEAANWTRTMLETLEYLHSKNIVHCDLKPENIVFKDIKGCKDIIFIDFGLAKIVNDNTIYNDLCANKYYTAPEIAEHYLNLSENKNICIELSGKVWKMCDIWAVGVIAYIMVLKTLPFFSRTDRGTFERIVNDKLVLPSLNDRQYLISNGFRDFITKILDKNPYRRLKVDEALRHPWIKGISSIDIKLNKTIYNILKPYGYQNKFKQLITKYIINYKENELGIDNEIIEMHFKRLD
eukprot:178277_1